MVKIEVEAGSQTPASSSSVRTCIGCKRTAAREHLVRLVRSASETGQPEALVDLRRRMPGRGAWLHPSPDCLQLAIKRRAIVRALPGVSNVSDVESQLADASSEGITKIRNDIVPL